jgi:hypothetical protein
MKPSNSALLNGTNIDDISGSVNDKSGSVLSSLVGKSQASSSEKSDTVPEPTTISNMTKIINKVRQILDQNLAQFSYKFLRNSLVFLKTLVKTT